MRGFFTGEVGTYKGTALKNPDYELLTGDDEEDRLHGGRIVPIYRLTEKVTQRMLRRWVYTALECGGEVPDLLPLDLRARRNYPPAADALRAVHFPATMEEAERHRCRFAYEELLTLQCGILLDRARRVDAANGIAHRLNGPCLKALHGALPFALTEAQDRVISDILRDMAAPRPMVRLVQGDVGCGKTVVALHAIAAAVDGGHQAVLMAPTEILAEQHYLHLRDLLAPLGLEVAQLTGAMRGAQAIRERIASGQCGLVVGTHALIQEKTTFHKLGLVIVDEQHRFGIAQRHALIEKGRNTDVLHLSATPIPRSLCLTVYGGMDISVIDALPPGRKPIKTSRVPAAKVPGLYGYIREQAQAGLQTYIICKLIEESENWDVTPVIRHFEELSAGPLDGLRTELLHGRLAAEEKDAIMARFKAREIDVLFSTTVIEVGIDVATATTMVIEDAAQFGLTQLHQLRGRVGRGDKQSYCFLLGKPTTKDGKKRLDILCEHTSGFDIAEADLKLRGPGEFFGARQAGLSDLRAADLIRDTRLLDRARRDTQEILNADPGLARPEHAALAQAARRHGALRVCARAPQSQHMRLGKKGVAGSTRRNCGRRLRISNAIERQTTSLGSV